MLKKFTQATWPKSIKAIAGELGEDERKDLASFTVMCTWQPKMMLPVLIYLLMVGAAVLVYVVMQSLIRDAVIHAIMMFGYLAFILSAIVVITKVGNARMLGYCVQFFRRRHIVTTRCVKCGYDLQMITREDCPECGLVVVRGADELMKEKVDEAIEAECEWLRKVDQTLRVFIVSGFVNGGVMGLVIGLVMPMFSRGEFWRGAMWILCSMAGFLVAAVVLFVQGVRYKREIDGVWENVLEAHSLLHGQNLPPEAPEAPEVWA